MNLYGFYQVSSPIGHTRTENKQKEMLERSDIKATSVPKAFFLQIVCNLQGVCVLAKNKNKKR